MLSVNRLGSQRCVVSGLHWCLHNLSSTDTWLRPVINMQTVSYITLYWWLDVVIFWRWSMIGRWSILERFDSSITSLCCGPLLMYTQTVLGKVQSLLSTKLILTQVYQWPARRIDRSIATTLYVNGYVNAIGDSSVICLLNCVLDPYSSGFNTQLIRLYILESGWRVHCW